MFAVKARFSAMKFRISRDGIFMHRLCVAIWFIKPESARATRYRNYLGTAMRMMPLQRLASRIRLCPRCQSEICYQHIGICRLHIILNKKADALMRTGVAIHEAGWRGLPQNEKEWKAIGAPQFYQLIYLEETYKKDCGKPTARIRCQCTRLPFQFTAESKLFYAGLLTNGSTHVPWPFPTFLSVDIPAHAPQTQWRDRAGFRPASLLAPKWRT